MSDAMEDEKLKAIRARHEKRKSVFKSVTISGGDAGKAFGQQLDDFDELLDRLTARPATAGSDGTLGDILLAARPELRVDTPAAAVTREQISQIVQGVVIRAQKFPHDFTIKAGQDVELRCGPESSLSIADALLPLLSRAAPTVDEWRPIETAKKSRSVGHMRMFGSGPGVHLCEFIGMWNDHCWVDAYTGNKMEPTHWQPCKAPIPSGLLSATPEPEGA